jgi:hypothetical protein
MLGRLYQLLVVLLWLASMTWLVVEKVLPPLLGGTPPDYNAVLAARGQAPDCWRIVWKEQTIGFAASRVIEPAGADREIRSVVQFEKLPLEELLAELLGVFAKLTAPLLGGHSNYRIDALLATRLLFDDQRRLKEFRTRLDVGEMASLLSIRGTVTSEQKLEVEARLGTGASGSGPAGQVLRQRIDLPPQALVDDAWTPRSQLGNLRVGQAWTVPVYRPFPPNSPISIIEAKVERHDVIVWDGRDVETLLIVYRADAGSGIRASREPVGQAWVRGDGTVLRQEVALSGLRLRFERLPDKLVDRRAQLLDEKQNPRLWSDLGLLSSSPARSHP